jgi:hypothetical protein
MDSEQALGEPAAPGDDDTEGCLCLVAGYAKKDGLIADVTTEAERLILMSPALGDFLKLRYVDLGPQPGQAGDRYRPVHRIVRELMTVREAAGRNHFALVVITKSAMTIEELLGSCAADPFLARLRMRVAGIASSDDREEGNRSVDVTSSPARSWQNERQLVDALRQRCEELPRYFAARGEPGLTRAEFAALRHAHAQPAVNGGSPEGGGVAGETSTPDVLDDASQTADTVSAQDVVPADVVAGIPTGSAAGGQTSSNALRWLPRVPWGRERRTAEVRDPDVVAPARTAMGLVYLLMIMDQDSGADPALDRLQAALLDMDRRLAAQPTCRYQVRVIHGSDGDLRTEMQDAGTVGRRVAKRSVRTGDFAALFRVIRGSLRRDCRLVQTIATASGMTVALPTVVIFTADPPMADTGTASVFGEVAAEAMVVWVVPGKLEGLVSPAFGAACGATVLGEHQAVADEILDLMQADPLKLAPMQGERTR